MSGRAFPVAGKHFPRPGKVSWDRASFPGERVRFPRIGNRYPRPGKLARWLGKLSRWPGTLRISPEDRPSNRNGCPSMPLLSRRRRRLPRGRDAHIICEGRLPVSTRIASKPWTILISSGSLFLVRAAEKRGRRGRRSIRVEPSGKRRTHPARRL